jgi:hypothetical protein
MNHFFSPDQFAYRPLHSATLMAFSHDAVNSIQADGESVLRQEDISGAFDRVSFSRLLGRLKCAGVHQRLVDMFSSFLNERSAVVVKDNRCSYPFTPLGGIPQGSPLSAVLWVIVFAPACWRVREESGVNTYCFADDFDTESSDLAELENASTVLSSVCDSGGFKLDVAKRNDIKFHKQNRGEKHQSTVFVGITFDSTLSMSQHTDKIRKKARQRLGQLLKARTYLNNNQLAMSFKAFVLPVLEVGSPIMQLVSKPAHLGKLIKYLNRFMLLLVPLCLIH